VIEGAMDQVGRKHGVPPSGPLMQAARPVTRSLVSFLASKTKIVEGSVMFV
jgi:hypothetical protein